MSKYLIFNHATQKGTIVEADSEAEAAQKLGCRLLHFPSINTPPPKLAGLPISKAIEILTIHNDHNPNFTDKEREEAHQLGIAALNRLEENRRYHTIGSAILLPGETLD